MKNCLLLTALAMTTSVAVTAQVAVQEKPVKRDASAMVKREKATFMKRTAMQKAEGFTNNFVVKSARDLNNTKSLPIVSLKDDTEETEKELYYRLPTLPFFCADAGGYIYPAMYLPAYATQTWANASSGYTASDPFTWSYVDIEGNDTITSSVHLTTAHFQGFAVAGADNVTPVLSCGEDSYQFVDGRRSNPYYVFYGWEPKLVLAESEGEEWLLQLYDNWENHVGTGLYYAYTATTNEENAAMVTQNWAKTINEDFAEYGVQTQSVKVTSMGNLLPAPASPYILSSVTFPVCVVNEAGAEVSLNIYSVTDEGKLKLLTTSQTVIEEAHALTSEGYSIVDLSFNIEYEDEANMVQNFLKVSTPIFIELTNINDNEKITELMGMGVGQDYDNLLKQGLGRCYGMTGLDATVTIGEGEDAQTKELSLYEEMPNGAYYGDDTHEWIQLVSSFDMVLDAYYPYLGLFDPDNDWSTVLDTSIELELPATDAYKYYQVTSYDLATSEDADPALDWNITDAEGDELPAWLHVEMDSETEGESTYWFLTITADDILGEKEPAREAVVNVDAAGAVRTFHITQKGTVTGIKAVAGADGKVVTEAVYTLDGQLVNADMKELNKGVYIVKKSNGTSAKVVKK